MSIWAYASFRPEAGAEQLATLTTRYSTSLNSGSLIRFIEIGHGVPTLLFYVAHLADPLAAPPPVFLPSTAIA